MSATQFDTLNATQFVTHHQQINEVKLSKHINERNGWYYYRRRVPRYIKQYENRNEVLITLKTRDFSEAIVRAQIYNDHVEAYWKALIKSKEAGTETQKYQAAIQLAKAYGFAYKTTHEIAQSPLEEIIERLSQNIQSKEEAEALLGGIDHVELKLSDCNEQYWKLTTDRIAGKTPHQISKWTNPRKSSLLNFISVVEDKPLQQVSRSDILAFKDWWRGKIAEGRSTSTANKQLQQLKDILRTVANENNLELDVDSIFANTSFQNNVKPRPPFEAKYVQDTLLPALEKLNARDRAVLWAMANTGARESEIFGLTKEDIRLEDDVPFIWIRPREGYSLKTPTSERKIPLVGTALAAFQENPKGFQHKGNPDTFSNIVNKYLTVHDLRPTPRHSAYSLRHTFKDRLRDIEAPEELIDSLMGHKKKGPQYGRGYKLEAKHNWLKKIAFELPN